jgi:GNAT superfamily N-acetyltransferase
MGEVGLESLARGLIIRTFCHSRMRHPIPLPDFLPGRLRLEAGSAKDYGRLAPLHYRAGRPATWAAIACVRHELPHLPEPRVAGVAVLSWPTAVNLGRRRAFALHDMSFGSQLRWANTNVRTISRVIVRPEYRGTGLGVALVAELVRRCKTRFIESSAAMGAFHPMFDRVGFSRIELPDRPTYFWRETRSRCAPAAAGAQRGSVGHALPDQSADASVRRPALA